MGCAILLCMTFLMVSGSTLIVLILHLLPRVVCTTLTTPLLIPPQTAAQALDGSVQVLAQALLLKGILAPTLLAVGTPTHPPACIA